MNIEMLESDTFEGAEDRSVASPLFRTEHLRGGYGSVKILFNINLSVKDKEIVTVIGPNGCGKSTFLKVAYGLATYHGGGVEYRNENITGLRTDQLVKKGISYVPQVNNIFPDLTVNENLEMGGYLKKSDLSDDLEQVYQMFPDLASRRTELASNLSGGQRQMLALGRALMSDPKFLLLDEPTAALSPLYVEQIMQKITELRDEVGMAIVLVEQNAKSALKHSDYAYIFSRGIVVHHDIADNILNDPKIGELFLGIVKE